jgi:hypothetical protein
MERGRERADPCHKGENGASTRRQMADQCAEGLPSSIAGS